jgi:hypothetical protein
LISFFGLPGPDFLAFGFGINTFFGLHGPDFFLFGILLLLDIKDFRRQISDVCILMSIFVTIYSMNSLLLGQVSHEAKHYFFW